MALVYNTFKCMFYVFSDTKEHCNTKGDNLPLIGKGKVENYSNLEE